jgi:hypothetical protein
MSATLDLYTRIPAAIRDGAGNRRQVALALGFKPEDDRFEEAWNEARLRGLVDFVWGCCDGHGVHDDSCEVALTFRVDVGVA